MYQKEFLSLEEARAAADAAMALAMKHPARPCAVAVVDPVGDLIYFVRQDGAPMHYCMLAMNKAYTAARFRRDTTKVDEPFQGIAWYRGVRDFMDPRYTPIPGGMCVKKTDGTVVGAVGISGRTSKDEVDDLAIGRAAFKALAGFGLTN